MIRKAIYLPVFGLILLLYACSAQTPQSDLRGAFLVDVRTPAEFAEGSVPGAVNIPLQEIPQRINEFKNKKQVVVFCRSGSRSRLAKEILEQHGITNVVDGGPWQSVARKIR
ncbi:MAG: rhodanese-like domain-containing protein [Chitinophagales bacterium]|nr:rhodanese-like domain-containing protein [Chitinophagales bacterium]MDW8418530.1 rhodanese-like domain-containing protein [Chitinophagales bacterium]